MTAEAVAVSWLAVLTEECRKASQNAVAERIGYSPSVVSQVLKGSYRGNLAQVEAAVRGAFMHATVDCPVLGELPTNECMSWQRKPYAASNFQRLQMFRACRNGCPSFRATPEKPEERTHA